MAQRYYQGDGSDPMRKDKVNAAMEFIEERLLSRDHATGQLVGPWAACLTSMLGNADREAELDFLLKSVKHADRTLFFMSYKEIHEREKLRKQARGGPHRPRGDRGGISKLGTARSRRYRSQILQVNTRWKALAEIYTMHSFAPFWNLNFFVKNC